ncbi:MAG: peptide chain release factor family protein [Phycisphaerales bacterium JB063]
MPHPAALEIDTLLADCDVQRTRGSGPGGQNRNKVETAIRLTHRPTGLSVLATERRSQEQNRAAAVARLRVKLALAVRRPVGSAKGTPTPSPRWSARVKGGRLAINPGHDDFPALLAEALDHLEADGYDVAVSAAALGVSTSQLVKLLRHEPAGLEQVNRERKQRGLRGLA